MDVIGTGLTPAKELMPDDACIPAVLVAGPLERRDVGERWDRSRVARQNVHARLGAQARYRSAADVLERQPQFRGGSQNAGCLGAKEGRPTVIVVDESHRSGFKTEWILRHAHEEGMYQSFVCRFRDGPFDAYETNGGFHVQAARPQLRDLARRVRRRPPPGTGAPTRRGWRGAARLVRRHARVSRDKRKNGRDHRSRQRFCQALLIDEIHVAIAPILLGSGEALFAGMDLPALGYACTKHVTTPAATHVVLARRA